MCLFSYLLHTVTQDCSDRYGWYGHMTSFHYSEVATLAQEFLEGLSARDLSTAYRSKEWRAASTAGSRHLCIQREAQ